MSLVSNALVVNLLLFPSHRQKEEELRNSLDPKYSHLTDELHVEISALAPPAEAHARIAYALAEVKKYLIPDTNDMIWQTQMRDIDRGMCYKKYSTELHVFDWQFLTLTVEKCL